MKTTPENRDNEGVELLSSETNASITRHWMENGQHHSLSEEMEGDSEEVKKWASPRRAGEKITVRNVHTKQKYAQTVHKNTTDGITKARHTWEVQTDDFGDGKAVNKANYTQGTTNSNENDPEDEEGKDVGPHQFLKNMIDNTENRLNAKEGSDNNRHILAIVVGICALAIAVAAIFIR